MPQNSNELINIYRKVIEPKLKHWVVFENGTCIIIYNLKGDLKTEAIEVLKKYGAVTPGTSSADFSVTKVDEGWIVSGDQPGILNFVSRDEAKDMEDYEIGVVGRDKRIQDTKGLTISHIEKVN